MRIISEQRGAIIASPKKQRLSEKRMFKENGVFVPEDYPRADWLMRTVLQENKGMMRLESLFECSVYPDGLFCLSETTWGVLHAFDSGEHASAEGFLRRMILNRIRLVRTAAERALWCAV